MSLSMNASGIRLRDVSKSYTHRGGVRAVLSNVSMEIEAGERVAFVGPNGSGKTTLLRIILGLDALDSGSIDGVPPLDTRAIAYIPQDYRSALFPWFRLARNLSLATNVGAIQPEKPAAMHTAMQADTDLLTHLRVTFDLDKFPYELSGGEQQIFLLARAVMQRPRVLVLDEALSAIDFGRKRLIQAYLGKWIANSRCTLLFASHDFEEAVMLADRVVVLERDRGNIKAVIPVDLPWPRTPATRSEVSFQASVERVTNATICAND